ncbi:hypothetical protein [Antarctobacter jejuensis]
MDKRANRCIWYETGLDKNTYGSSASSFFKNWPLEQAKYPRDPHLVTV